MIVIIYGYSWFTCNEDNFAYISFQTFGHRFLFAVNSEVALFLSDCLTSSPYRWSSYHELDKNDNNIVEIS